MKVERGELKEEILPRVSPILGRIVGGGRAEEEISVKKRRLFDCFKNAEGIRFRKFTAQIPTMIHRAVLAPPFWRQKVAETNV